MMKMLVLAAALLLPQDHSADPLKVLTDAVKKLADQESYSWSLKIEERDARSGPGKGARRDMPTLPALAGSRTKTGFILMKVSGPEGSASAVIKLGKPVFETRTGWKSTQELSPEKDARAFYFSTVLAFYPMPPDQLPGLLSGVTEVRTVSEGTYAGKLSPASARALLEWTLQGGGMGVIPEIRDAAGTVGIEVSKGIISKYTVAVTGSAAEGEAKFALNRTVQVSVKDVNGVKADATPEAKKKLE